MPTTWTTTNTDSDHISDHIAYGIAGADWRYFYTILARDEPTSGRVYVNYPRGAGKSFYYQYYNKYKEYQESLSKRKLTDIIGEPDWIV